MAKIIEGVILDHVSNYWEKSWENYCGRYS